VKLHIKSKIFIYVTVTHFDPDTDPEFEVIGIETPGFPVKPDSNPGSKTTF
jgi:hypothetical protein